MVSVGCQENLDALRGNPCGQGGPENLVLEELGDSAHPIHFIVKRMGRPGRLGETASVGFQQCLGRLLKARAGKPSTLMSSE